MHTVGENAHSWGKCTQLGEMHTVGEMHTAGENAHSWGKCTQLGKMHTVGENAHSWGKHEIYNYGWSF